MGKKKNKMVVKVNILPTEIEEIIMSKVPIKTILRFMSVCKSWYSLFLNPYFINIHSKNIPNNYNNLLLKRLGEYKDLVVMDSSSSVVRSRLYVNSKLGNGRHDYAIVGSYNGIVCVHGICRYYDADGTLNEYFFLWNPALKIIKKIMNCVGYLDRGRSGETYVGFGFDNHSNDYNVIRFHNTYDTEIQVEIYTLSSYSWRIVKVAPPHYIRRFSFCGSSRHALGVYVNGAHHWVVAFQRKETGYSFAIISFDIGEQVFKEIVIPSECMKSELIIFNCHDSLAILMRESTDYTACIWMMKDYGVPESWTKLCNIDIRQQLGMLKDWGLIETNNEVIFSSYNCGAKRSIVFDIDKSEAKNASKFITNTEGLNDAYQGHVCFATEWVVD